MATKGRDAQALILEQLRKLPRQKLRELLRSMPPAERRALADMLVTPAERAKAEERTRKNDTLKTRADGSA